MVPILKALLEPFRKEKGFIFVNEVGTPINLEHLGRTWIKAILTTIGAAWKGWQRLSPYIKTDNNRPQQQKAMQMLDEAYKETVQ